MTKHGKKSKAKQSKKAQFKHVSNVRSSASSGNNSRLEKQIQPYHSPLPPRDPLEALPRLTYSQSGADKALQTRDVHLLDDIPMEYRAQIPGRCQRQFVSEDRSQNGRQPLDVVVWLQEWIQGSSEKLPSVWSDLIDCDSVHAVHQTILQRLISNCGTDDGLIRPVIGAEGWPVIPGSSIKGLFRRRCSAMNHPKTISWCGNSCGVEPAIQGSLRFHGAFPIKPEWRKSNGAQTLDLVHPQWRWQLGYKDQKHSAFALISLLKPEVVIPISSSDSSMTEKDWEDIKSILTRAVRSEGIGGRTASGYGVSGPVEKDQVIFQCNVLGRGSASKLLNGTPEYRSFMFRAAIRGMALRIFGGLCDEPTAEQKVDELFGGLLGDRPKRGILSCRYIDLRQPLLEQSKTTFSFTLYTASGSLQWGVNRLSRHIGSEERATIQNLLESLHGLVMTLGGFGKGWRRIDHEFFGQSLGRSGYTKAPIGCHWQWEEYDKLPDLLKVHSASDVKALLDAARNAARRLIGSKASEATASMANWQEVIHPDRTLIWTRIADNPSDSMAMKWFHAKKNERGVLPSALCLHRTDIGGRLENSRYNDGPTCVSRVWHRMYPLMGREETKRGVEERARPASRSSVFQRASRSAPLSTNQPKPAQFWNGPFLESFVLFPVNQRSAKLEKIVDSDALISELDRLATDSEENFSRLFW